MNRITYDFWIPLPDMALIAGTSLAYKSHSLWFI